MTTSPGTPVRQWPGGIETPPWIEGLPKDHRGFPVPAEAGWTEDNEPRIAMVGTDRKFALAMRRGCAVCGFFMQKGRSVYRAFSQADASQIRGYERESSQDLAGPLHKSCVLFSAIVCPYLRERTSRLGKNSQFGPGERRGTLAAVMGFEDMSVLVGAEPHTFLGENSPVPHVGYLRLRDDIKYRDGEELIDLYLAAVTEDAEFIDTTKDRLYWTNDDLPTLGRMLREDFDHIRKRSADYNLLLHPGTRYVGFYV